MTKINQSKSLQNFISDNPNLEAVELLVSDINGVLRGKWAPKAALKKLVDPGMNLPMSIFGLDVWGREVEETGLHIDTGDRDGFCQLVDERLAPVTWAKQNTAQALLTMKDDKGKPYFADPRNALLSVVNKLKRKGLYPVVAIELEFYVVDEKAYIEVGKHKFDKDKTNGAMGPDNQAMYSLSALRDNEELIAEIRTAASAQGLQIDTIIKEAAPGQYEINLNHRNDALAAADDAVLLRRVIVECAAKFDKKATFMAKPFVEWPGNGLHVHASMLDDDGNNIFAGKQGAAKLRHAAAGLLNSMEDCLLLFVSSYNGFRRLQKGSYAPTNIAWGHNNRSVAVRVPASNPEATRLEHRISGADANPYFVMASILGGMLDGLEKKSKPPKPITGNAYEMNLPRLTCRMDEAIDAFEASKFTTALYGKKMKKVITEVKRAELEAFANEISPLERSTYL